MLCEMCREREANVVIQTVTNGRVVTRSLCAECARVTQSEIAKAFFALGLKLQNARQPESRAQQDAEPLPRKICSSCGTPIDAVDEKTLFGCAECYGAFAEMIREAFPTDVQGNPEAARDAGPAGEGDPSGMPLFAKKEDLARQLKQAVFSENYELAATLRDKLREMASGDGKRGESVDG